ncbi:tape measure protein [Enterococcus sp. DIV1420a]|uniref:tape measure protein n=1 Tax=Enterococcus sp. DIV1420a TaxID=2774672 RepID=UPI003F29CC1E
MSSLSASLKLRDQFTATLKKIDSGMQQATKSMADFKKKATGPAQALRRLGTAAQTGVSKLNSSLRTGLTQATTVVKSSVERILSIFGSFGNRISGTLSSAFSGVTSKFSSLKSDVGKVFNTVTGRGKKIAALAEIDKQISSFKNKSSKIQINVEKLPQVQKQIANVDQRLKRLSNAKANIKANVTNADVAKKRLSALDKHMQRLNSKKAILEVEAGKLDKAKAHLADLQKSIENLSQKRIELNTSAFSTGISKINSAMLKVGDGLNVMKSKISSGFSAGVNAVKKGVSRIGRFLKQSGNAFKQYGNDIKNSFERMKKSAYSASGGFKSMVGAIGVTKAIGASFNMVKSSVGGAIERFDTLNQFPKMMQAIGFSTDDAARAKDALVKGIDGLPTTLGDVVSNTQQLATITHDLDGATKTTLSLNNAFLASGTDSARAADGFYQYSKMLSRGKVDMQSWQSVQATMGPALSELAESFGFAGKSAQNDLYNALKAGTLTFDQFNDKLIELYNTGTAGAEKALIGSEGIKTSFKNIRTAVTNGVEGSIRKLDSLFEKMGGKSIAKSLDGIKQKIKNVFAVINGSNDKAGLLDKLPGLIQKAQPYIEALKKAFVDMKQPIADAFNAVKDSLSKLTGGLGGQKSVKSFTSFLDSMVAGVKKIAGFIEKHSDTIVKFIPLLLKLAGAFIGFKIGKGLLGPLFNFSAGLFGIVKATGKLGGGLGKAFFGLFKKIPKMPKNPLGDKGGSGKEQSISPFGSLMKTFDGFTKGAAKLALIFGVIKLIEEAAEAMKQVNDKIPDNLATLGLKLLNMGIALTGMSTFVAIAGKMAEKNPMAAIAGLLFVALISGELLLAAEAMKQINDKVPSNIGDFASKMANMGIAIGGMSVLVGIVGALMTTGIGALIAGAGLLAIAAICGELILVAEAIQQVNDKVPDDLTAVRTKIKNIALVIQAFTESNLGNIADTFKNIIGVIDTAVVIVGIQKFIALADTLEQFQNVNVPTGTKAKIKEFETVLQAFSGTRLSKLITDMIQAADLAVVTKSIEALINIGKKFDSLAEIKFNPAAIKTSIDKIKEVVDYLSTGSGGIFDKIKQFFGNSFDIGVFYTANEAFEALIQVGRNIERLKEISFDEGSIVKKINSINTIIHEMGTAGLNQIIGTMLKQSELMQVKAAVEAMYNLVEPINKLAGVNVKAINSTTNIKAINALIEEIGTANLGKWVGQMMKANELGEVGHSIDALYDLIEPINRFAKETIDESINTKIAKVKEVIQKMNDLPEVTGIAGMEGMSATFVNLTKELNGFQQAAEVNIGKLGEISQGFTSNMDRIKQSVISTMTAIKADTMAGMLTFNQTLAMGMSQAAVTVQNGNQQIMSTFTGLRGQLFSAGLMAMSGLTSGIQAGAGSAIAAAESVAHRVATTVRSALDIHSPSRVFMKIGHFITSGLANGMLQAQNLVTKASDSLAQATISNQLMTVSTAGSVSSSVHLDDTEISKLQASANQKIIVNHKQVVPQVSIYVENKNSEPIDENALLETFEDKVMEMFESDMN